MQGELRPARLWPWLEALGQGLRQGARRLRRAPGFAAVAVVTLGLGIGANTAIFSLVEAVMLRPLPYPEAERIVAFHLRTRTGAMQTGVSAAQFLYVREHTRTLAAVGGYQSAGTPELEYGKGSTWASGLAVTDGFFATLGVEPRLGRGITRAETQAGAAGAVVLGDGLWRTAFGADPEIVGRAVRINGQAFTVVGVMPRSFTFQEQPADFYQALSLDNSLGALGLNTRVIGRLRPGATRQEVAAEAAALGGAMRQQGLLPAWVQGLQASAYQALEVSGVRTSLLFLLGAVGLLLLIACANVAGLVLARTLARQPELALRRALGAGQGRLFTQFLAEGMVLAGCGAAAGLGLAKAALTTLAAKLPWNVPLAGPIELDGRVLGFTLAVALGTSLLFGLAPAYAPAELRRRKQGWGRDAMVASEVALTLLLLLGAGLLVKSLLALERQPLGFDPAGRTAFATKLPVGAAPDTASAWRFDQQVLAGLQAMPGVSAAAISLPPLEGQNNLPGEPVAKPELGTAVEYRVVSPGYFTAMGIPILAGRDVGASDTAAAPEVAVVSASLARQWFGGYGALGAEVRLGAIGNQVYAPAMAIPRGIVGVAGDVKVESVSQPARLTIYAPAAQAAEDSTWWVARGRVSETEIRRAVAAANAEARVRNIGAYETAVAHTLARPAFEAELTSIFALLALALTAVGLYGLLAYTVTRRTHEIGIRLALGAQPGDVLRQVAGHGMGLAAAGIAAGEAATLPLGHAAASLLYGVAPTDAATLAAAAGMLGLVALAACTVPAWRATRVDLAQALREE